MSHQVLSRKYRPQQFADVVGQDHVARILRNAISSDRVGHAYLFVGPRGVGKTTIARLFARALNCSGREITPEDVEPCGSCPSCRDIAGGADYDVIEMDAASNNHVEDVRNLREQVGYAAVRAPYRIWIVDEVHMLSLPAFNAFLKTLEEPPPQVKFLFCTTEEHKLPDTFRSRCQRVEFRPIGVDAMAARLVELAAREDATLAPEVAKAIASGALGGLRDGESLLEQLLAACPTGAITLDDLDALAGRAPAELLGRLVGAIDAKDASAALDAVDECLATGCKPGVLFDQWLENARAAMVGAARTGEPVARLARAIDLLLAKRQHLRAGADGVLVSQIAAVELARLPDARDLDQLIAALRGQSASVDRTDRRAREPRAAAVPEAEAEPAPVPERQAPVARERAAAVSPERVDSGGGAAVATATEISKDAVSLASVSAQWSTFVDTLSRRDGRFGALLRRLVLHDVEHGRVHLRMTEEVDGARAMFSRREIQIAFSQIARKIYGTALVPVLEEIELSSGPDLVTGPDLSGHPTVAMVTEFTGGRLMNVEQHGGCERTRNDEE